MMRSWRHRPRVLLLAVILVAAIPTARAQDRSDPAPAPLDWDGLDPLRALLGPTRDGSDPVQALLGHARGAVRGQAEEVKARAWEVFRTVPRSGTCAERRAEIVKMLPDAVPLAQWDRDIYGDGYDDEMAASGARVMDIEPGRRAYRETSGQRYAEVRADPARKRVVIVFRGTRIEVASDVLTDIASHIGVETAYYGWAAGLVARVVREHPGFEVVATGHSLGGGLALYAGLRNPGTRVVVFNAAGLSLMSWENANDSDRARLNANAIVFATRNDTEIEPISALSFAGRSILPGHIVVVATDVTGGRALHGPTAMVHALEQLTADSAGASACDGAIGILAR